MVEKGAMAVPAAGLHARFINEAKDYSSEMPVVKNRIRANAKGSLRHMAHGEKVRGGRAGNRGRSRRHPRGQVHHLLRAVEERLCVPAAGTKLYGGYEEAEVGGRP